MTGLGPDAAQGMHGISVAAELVGTGVQNLRAYEAGAVDRARSVKPVDEADRWEQRLDVPSHEDE